MLGPTSRLARIGGIEAGRGIAAVLVILGHAAQHVDAAYGTPELRQLLRFSHAGVDFFFVISGFIILHVHRRDIGSPGRLRRYAARRFTRLAPTYWVVLAITVAISAAGHMGMPTPGDLFWSASLLPSDRPLILGIAWTLRVELLFYVLFGVLILSRVAGGVLLAAWFGMACVSLVSGAQVPGLPGVFQTPYVCEFALGMVAAWGAAEWAGTGTGSRLERVSGPVLAVGIVLFVVSAASEDLGLLDGYGGLARLAYGVPSALMVLGVAAWPGPEGLRVPAPLRVAGAASYSLYLFQYVAIAVAWQVATRSGLAGLVPPAWEFLVLSAAAVAGGIVASRTVEVPLMAALRRGTRAASVAA